MLAGNQWLMPVILAIWEEKIRRILAQSLQDTISKKNKTITKRAGVVA
jgi:hypothetical protein